MARRLVRRVLPVGAGGYSLIEMMIAVGMAAIIGMALYAIFNAQQRASRSQKTYNDLQTTCSFAMDAIKNDLMKAGQQSANPDKLITESIVAADSRSITFEYDDEDLASHDPPFDAVDSDGNFIYRSNTLVTLSYNSGSGEITKSVQRWHKNGAFGAPVSYVLASNASLNLSYLRDNNEVWPIDPDNDPATPPPLPYQDIRAIQVSLVCDASRSNAIYANPALGTTPPPTQQIALTAEIRPRNLGLSRRPTDITPPIPPLSQAGSPTVQIWDEGTCGCLKLRWTSNTESDVAGYMVFYGTSAGNYSGHAKVPAQSGPNQYYTLRNLDATGTPYYLAFAAYDKSGNQSSLSSEYSGNPATSVRVENGTGLDSAIHPLAPPAPGNLTVSTPADNQIRLNWTKTYSDCMTAPVFGYRIYRDTNPAFTPSGASAGVGNCIADESNPLLGPTATSYLDVGPPPPAPPLVGCVPYYYKIAVVHCDPSQLTNYTNPGPDTTTTYTAASFASITGTPTDGSAPGTASGTPILTSKAGYRRIILSLTNPSRAATQDPDFAETLIYFNTGATGPTLDVGDTRDANGYTLIDNGTLIPDGGGIVIDGGGPHTINFDDEDSEIPNGAPAGIGNPQLQGDATYNLLAVSYDRCRNHSTATDASQSTAEQCRDCLVSEGCRDAPPAPQNARVSLGCDGSPLRIEWDYPESYYTSHYDFQGFRVVRCTGENCVPLAPELGGTGTVIGSLYAAPDTYILDDTVVDGQIYNYRIYAVDCYYQRWLEGVLTAEDIAGNDPTNNSNWANVNNVALGYFDRAHVPDIDSETTLTASISPTDTVIPVVSTTGWTHHKVQINDEIIVCDGLTPTSFTDCNIRGSDGSFPTPHLVGTPVRSYPSAPAVAAVTGDLSLVPPTFLHNTIILGARNSSARQITLRQLTTSWVDAAWLKEIVFDTTTTAFLDTANPLTHGAIGSTLDLLPPNGVPVDGLANNIPLKLTFLKSDNTLDHTVDLREETIRLNWTYTNDATSQLPSYVMTCSRDWWPPPTGVVTPTGPSIVGTTQQYPTWGSSAWPVPGLDNNPIDALLVPTNSWNNISTRIYDNSGTGIASARLYYTDTDLATTVAPPVTAAYPGCAPYTMVPMSLWGFGDDWNASATIPTWPNLPTLLNNRRIWYFIVAVDNEGNFDRDPEVNLGAYEYFQKPENPCLTTPQSPQVVGSVAGSTVTLDWSSSWFGPPWIYYNTDWSVNSDLAGFRVFHQRGTGAYAEVAGSPFPPDQKTYSLTFPTAVTSLTAPVPALQLAPISLSVNAQTGFVIPGKVKVDDEIFSCAAMPDLLNITCTARAQDGTVAADHAAGASVTQNILELEDNSFQVRAYDSCTTGAKYSDSAVYTEGQCSPVCDLQVSTWPPDQIAPGDDVWLYINACKKAGNGTTDTIYAQVCSSVEGDDVQLVEDGDSGWFYVTNGLHTLLGSTPTGGNTTVVVAANDTLTIGGYASAAGSWGNVNNCGATVFSCGAARTLAVITPTPNPCATDHTPPTPAGVPTSARIAPDVCSGNGTSRQTLTWNKVAAPDGCTSMSYRGYQCEGSGCTPDTPINGFFTSEAANCTGTTCTSEPISVAPAKISNKVFRFAVSAVCEINNCTLGPAVQAWESLKGSTAADACP